MEDIGDQSDDNQLTKTKVKKPRSEKQMKAFEEAMKKRKENIEKRKEEKLIKASEILVKANKKQIVPQREENFKNKKIIMQEKLESESEEEEIIIVKSKPKPKKKLKKIIIEDSSDDETSIESDDGKEFNKKSYSKSKTAFNREQPIIQRSVDIPRPQKTVFNSADFFI